MRHIRLNPLRAKLVKDLGSLRQYPFSGHRLLAGAGECGWQDGAYVLGCFGKSVSAARKRVNAGIALGRGQELVGGGLVRSLGGWSEVKKMRLKRWTGSRAMSGYWGIRMLYCGRGCR